MSCGSVQGRISEQGYEDTLQALALDYTVSAVLKDHGFQDFFLTPYTQSMKTSGQNENRRSQLTSLSSGIGPPFFVSDTDLLLMQPTAQIPSTKPRKFKPAYHTQTRDVPR